VKDHNIKRSTRINERTSELLSTKVCRDRKDIYSRVGIFCFLMCTRSGLRLLHSRATRRETFQCSRWPRIGSDSRKCSYNQTEQPPKMVCICAQAHASEDDQAPTARLSVPGRITLGKIDKEYHSATA
jgi:hypothetical protein